MLHSLADGGGGDGAGDDGGERRRAWERDKTRLIIAHADDLCLGIL
jgi:hypothetical protein